MTAICCGKRTYDLFEDYSSSGVLEELNLVVAPPAFKRARCGGSPSRLRLSPRLVVSDLVSLFPAMDRQLLERTLDECGNDIDAAIRRLKELHLGSADNVGSVDVKTNAEETNLSHPTENSQASQNRPMSGAEWVDHFVNEMMRATNMDDAKSRASRMAEFFERSILERASTETQVLQEQNQTMSQENHILKRAVAIQHERLADKSKELNNVKQMLSQYQERLRVLEVNNYSLTMHLRQAQQSSPIANRFHPDVY